MYFIFFSIIILIYNILTYTTTNNLENCIASSIFFTKQCSKKNNSKFNIYIKFNNYLSSPISVSTIIKPYKYYTKNNTIITPYFDYINCLDEQYFDINCFTKIDLVRNNNYNYVWLKFEKKDKTPFMNKIDLYIYDMYNIINHKSIYSPLSFNNINFVNGNYSLYSFNIDIDKKNSLYFRIKLN